MERKVVRQEGKNFWGRNFPGASGAEEAKGWLDDYARTRDGYEVILKSAALQYQSAKEVLLTDKRRNIKHLRLSWLPLVGHRIVESDLSASEAKDIDASSFTGGS